MGSRDVNVGLQIEMHPPGEVEGPVRRWRMRVHHGALGVDETSPWFPLGPGVIEGLSHGQLPKDAQRWFTALSPDVLRFQAMARLRGGGG